MKYTEISFKMSTDYSDSNLRIKISKQLHIKEFSFEILKKSLDARQ
ncbi:MAG: hypothetical protein PF693_08615 [Spirochaetia bacterium]|nr:hypothetical protein [Spirochaetia bacterium]